MTRLGLGLPSAAIHRPRHQVSQDAEAAALLARMSPPPAPSRAALIASLVSQMRAAGLWAKLDAFYVLAAHDAQAARLNWIADHYNLAAVNAPVFTADRGYAGNGTSSYLDTGFNPTTATGANYALNAASLSVWSLTDVQRATAAIGGGTAYVTPKDAGTMNITYAVNTTGDRTRANPLGTSIGLFTACRPDATFTVSYANGANALSQGNNSTSLPNVAFRLCGRASAQSDSRQVAFACFGRDLSAVEVGQLYGAVRTYLVGVGAVAP